MIDHQLIGSGLFYPDSQEQTDELAAKALAAAASQFHTDSTLWSRAIIVPHGSYDYILEPLAAAWHAAASMLKKSGETNRTGEKREAVKTAVFFLPAHAPHPEGLEGFFIPETDTYRTLSGTLSMNTKMTENIFKKFADKPKMPYLHQDSIYISEEPALELNFPFIERLFGDSIRILPIFCSTLRSKAARLLGEIISSIDTPDTLYAVSTNITGYEPYPEAWKHVQYALSWLQKRNEEKKPLLEAVRKHELTLCNPLPLEGLRRAGISDGCALPFTVNSSAGHSMSDFSSIHAENPAYEAAAGRTGSGKQQKTTFFGGCICLKQP